MSKAIIWIGAAVVALGIGSAHAMPLQGNLGIESSARSNVQTVGWGDAFRAWVNGCRYGERWMDEHWVQIEVIGPGGRYRSGAVLVDAGCIQAI